MLYHLNWFQRSNWPRGVHLFEAANQAQLVPGARHSDIDDIQWIQDHIADKVTERLERP